MLVHKPQVYKGVINGRSRSSSPIGAYFYFLRENVHIYIRVICPENNDLLYLRKSLVRHYVDLVDLGAGRIMICFNLFGHLRSHIQPFQVFLQKFRVAGCTLRHCHSQSQSSANCTTIPSGKCQQPPQWEGEGNGKRYLLQLFGSLSGSCPIISVSHSGFGTCEQNLHEELLTKDRKRHCMPSCFHWCPKT